MLNARTASINRADRLTILPFITCRGNALCRAVRHGMSIIATPRDDAARPVAAAANGFRLRPASCLVSLPPSRPASSFVGIAERPSWEEALAFGLLLNFWSRLLDAPRLRKQMKSAEASQKPTPLGCSERERLHAPRLPPALRGTARPPGAGPSGPRARASRRRLPSGPRVHRRPRRQS
jgi:hypothetical protein